VIRTFEHPDMDELTIGVVLSALSDPHRRRIVRQLADGPSKQTCGQFALPMGKPAQSYHFRVLREAGIIRQQYAGTAILNALRAADMQTRFPGLLESVISAERSEALIGD
jgi:DNA-binding transcriptional ArsR family regulator